MTRDVRAGDPCTAWLLPSPLGQNSSVGPAACLGGDELGFQS